MSKNLIRVKGKRPKKSKIGWWSMPKSKREAEKAAQKKHRAKMKKVIAERADASAKHRMALKRRAELAAKKLESGTT